MQKRKIVINFCLPGCLFFSGYRSISVASANLLTPIKIKYANKLTNLSCFKFLDNLEYSKFKNGLIGILFPNYESYVQITPGNSAGSFFSFFTIDLEKSPACGDTSQKGQLSCVISSKGILPCQTSPDILILHTNFRGEKETKSNCSLRFWEKRIFHFKKLNWPSFLKNFISI